MILGHLTNNSLWTSAVLLRKNIKYLAGARRFGLATMPAPRLGLA